MSKQSKKLTAPSEVAIPMKELTTVYTKPTAESTKRKVPRYQMTKGIVEFVSAIKAIYPNTGATGGSHPANAARLKRIRRF